MRHGIATLAWVTVVIAILACSSVRVGSSETGQPRVAFPAAFEPEGDGGAERPAESPGGSPPISHADPPDPEPLRIAEQWEYTVHYRRGALSIDRVRPVRLAAPRVTPRRMGRYAIELWIGRELVERVRFDFPLLAAEPAPSGPRRPIDEPPSLAAGADVAVSVLVPQSPRATSARLVDRATGERIDLPWPPDAPIEPAERSAPPDGGAEHRGS
jgi:hypothetical protein